MLETAVDFGFAHEAPPHAVVVDVLVLDLLEGHRSAELVVLCAIDLAEAATFVELDDSIAARGQGRAGLSRRLIRDRVVRSRRETGCLCGVNDAVRRFQGLVRPRSALERFQTVLWQVAEP
jgi:hypothetical protein